MPFSVFRNPTHNLAHGVCRHTSSRRVLGQLYTVCSCAVHRMETSRQRVLNAIGHVQPEVTPVNLMGFAGMERWLHHFGAADYVDLRLKLGLDLIDVRPVYVGPNAALGLDIWGVPANWGGAEAPAIASRGTVFPWPRQPPSAKSKAMPGPIRTSSTMPSSVGNWRRCRPTKPNGCGPIMSPSRRAFRTSKRRGAAAVRGCRCSARSSICLAWRRPSFISPPSRR